MKSAWKILIGVLAALLILLLIAEAGLRIFLSKQIEDGFEAQYAAQSPGVVAAKPDVSFGATPLTIGMLGGSLPHMTIRTPSTLMVNDGEITGEPAATIAMDKVRLVDQEPIADHLSMQAELPSELLQAILNQAISEQLGNNALLDTLITVSSVTTDAEAGTFTLSFTRGAANIDIRPVPTADGVQFETTGTQLFGFDLPGEITEAITQSLQEGLANQEAGAMRLNNVMVTPEGLVLEMTGEKVNFYELQQMSVTAPGGVAGVSAQ